MKLSQLNSLKCLALLGALKKPIKISSNEFTTYTSTSSKTAARILKQLEDNGFIDRNMIYEGQIISITKQGHTILKSEFSDYKSIFCDNEDTIELYGHVITGLGEGQYYICQEGYRTQFKEKLNFEPYPGTLNVKLNSYSAAIQKKIDIKNTIPISEFTDGNRTFGSCNCYFVDVEDIMGVVVTPKRTHYPNDLLEIISPMHLRKKLKLEDGDEVKITIRQCSKYE